MIMLFKHKKVKGFTLVEVIIAVAVTSMILVGFYSMYARLIKNVRDLRAKSAATLIANESFEVARNLPYSDVGIEGGIPAGKIPYEQTIERSGMKFKVTATVRNYDDPFDGQIGSDTKNDLSPADGKLVEFEVSCLTCENSAPVYFTTRISPKNLETASTNGALFVRVFGAAGQAIPQASVSIKNKISTTTIEINDKTDNTGLLQLVDVPPGADAYEIIVTKDGYSSDKTYPVTVTNRNPYSPQATVVNQAVTQVSLSIDRLSTLNIHSISPLCASVPSYHFSMKGEKKIGVDPEILKFSENYSTNGSGQLSLSNVEWDNYTFLWNDTSYDILGTNPISPLSIFPGSINEMNIVLVPKVPKSVAVVVKDSASKLPISDANVTLDSETQVTSQGYISQTDWSGGSGQENFSNQAMYSSSDGKIDVSNQGVLKLNKDDEGSYYNSGELISSVFDVGTTSNFSNLNWLPTDQPQQTGVKFQIASSDLNTSTTTWNFVGPGNSNATFYTTTNRDLSADHSGKRYIRYKAILSSTSSSTTPILSDVSINFTSGCIPSGQVLFSGLTDGNKTLHVSKAGYDDYTGTILVSDDYMSKEVLLNTSN